MGLSDLQSVAGSERSDNSRKGRDHGSGNGKTAGKGRKSQEARSGTTRPGFEGGQMPLHRRLPKCGLTNTNSRTVVGVNVSTLERFDNDVEITVEALIEASIVKDPRDGVKILGNRELAKKLAAKVNTFNEGARSKIEILGGACEVI